MHELTISRYIDVPTDLVWDATANRIEECSGLDSPLFVHLMF